MTVTINIADLPPAERLSNDIDVDGVILRDGDGLMDLQFGRTND